MKVLAVDYGDKKTGLAISDELGIVTTKLPVLFSHKEKHKIEGLFHVVVEFKPQLIVFGIPQLSDEFENEQEKIIKEFVNKFQLYLTERKTKLECIPQITFWDESFSSQTVELGRTKNYINKKSDSDAARIFLQEFLDSPDGFKTWKSSI